MADKGHFVDRLRSLGGFGDESDGSRDAGEILEKGWDVLILSGDAARSKELAGILTALNHRVQSFGNSRSFHNEIRTSKPHVVFVDWELSGGGFGEVLEELQGEEAFAGIWVVGFAEQSETESWEEMVALGCSDILRLPATEPMVRARMALAQPIEDDAAGGVDELTGFANRAGFTTSLDAAFARAGRRPFSPFAVLCFDMDNFKSVNNGLGHEVGDALLRALAERIGAISRPGDTLGRFAGDVFFLLVSDIADAASATAAADRLQRECQASFDLDGVEVFTSISVGIALWKKEYGEAAELLRDAETALHRAKDVGRDTVSVFDTGMHVAAVESLDLENDLRRAVERKEFHPFFQPIVSIPDGRIIGFEALARWHHPEKGILPPAVFIDAAEKMGVIIQIDRMIVERACRQLRAWRLEFRDLGQLTMSVNISTRQFLQPDLVQQIDLVLRSTGLYGKSLKLEVTENVLMDHSDYASQMLEQLRKLDIGISIDDFGTGYSSFTYLRSFEIDILKIDRSFVSQMTRDGGSAEIVATVATLAKNLGKVTVAEGVETRSQLEALESLGADHIQGFFVAEPLSSDGAEALLASVLGVENHLEKILEDRLQGG